MAKQILIVKNGTEITFDPATDRNKFTVIKYSGHDEPTVILTGPSDPDEPVKHIDDCAQVSDDED